MDVDAEARVARRVIDHGIDVSRRAGFGKRSAG
jgi:hypothetical protein